MRCVSLALLLLSGCTSASRLDAEPLTDSRIATIQQAVKGQTATLVWMAGGEEPAQALTVQSDSTWWTDLSGTRQGAATRDLYLVRVRPGRMPAGDSAMLGAIGGAVAAFVLAGTGESSPPSRIGGDPRPLAAIPGALVGALVGLAVGSRPPAERTFVLTPRTPSL